MKWMSCRMACAVLVCGAGWLHGPQARAQSLGDTTPYTGSAGTVPSGTVPQTPSLTTPMFSTGVTNPQAIPNASGAAAFMNPLAFPNASAAGSSTQGSIFNNPLAAPLIYNSMLQASMPYGSMGTSSSTTSSSSTSSTAASSANSAYRGMGLMGPTTQLGMLMLLSNQQNGGLGSGQLSGMGGSSQQTRMAQAASDPRRRGANRPGGLAARYFNHVSPHSAYPKTYFNRKPRYYP
jgi:hypothetical protein